MVAAVSFYGFFAHNNFQYCWQIATLKETIAKKDEELGAVQQPKDPKSAASGEKRGPRSLR